MEVWVSCLVNELYWHRLYKTSSKILIVKDSNFDLAARASSERDVSALSDRLYIVCLRLLQSTLLFLFNSSFFTFLYLFLQSDLVSWSPILLDILQPGQTINLLTTLQCWLSWSQLGLSELGQRRQSFSCNMIMPGLISGWTMDHVANLSWTVLPRPPYSLNLVPSD